MALIAIAAAFRRLLVPFLETAAAILLTLLVILVVQRAIRAVALQRNRRVQHRYRALVDTVLEVEEHHGASEMLGRAPRRHRPIIAALMLAPLGSLSGPPVERARDLARALGLVGAWRDQLSDRRWWRRADAARALGLIGERSAWAGLIAALDDAHEEVRASAVESLGRLADPRAVPELLARMPHQSRHQRVRIVEALRALGREAGPQLLEYARGHAESLPLVADLLVLTVGSAAVDDLVTWCDDERPDTRAAAIGALGSIGLDDRTYYYALKLLGDPDRSVRAMAARALGRSGRVDAAPYLAQHLDDDWTVAAHSARALRGLAASGLRLLEDRALGEGPGAALARQMVWEAGARLGRRRTSAVRPGVPGLAAT